MFEFIRDKKNRHFFRLWWAQLVSQFGDRINQMALIGLIAQREPGSAMGLAKLFSFTIFPVFIIGPIAGVYVDRWDRRKTLFVCDFLRAVLVLTIPGIFIFHHSMVPIYIVVFCMFCFSRFYTPAKMSFIPDLVVKDNLLMANSLMTVTGMIAFATGLAVGGFLVDMIGARGGFIVDSATFFFSALLIMSISRDIRFTFDRSALIASGRDFLRIERSVFGEIREGFLYLRQLKEIRFIISMLFILLSGAGAVYIVIIVFIQKAFHSVTRDVGMLAVFLGVGLFLGALSYGKWGKKVRWYKTIFCCLLFGGLMLAIFSVAVSHHIRWGMAAALAFLMGAIIGPVFIASNTIVQMVSDSEMRGKVFAALEIVIHFAFLVAMFVSSFLSGYIRPLWILVGVGTLFSVIGLAGLWRYKDGKGLAQG